MVFGILTSVAAVPAIVGTTEAIRQGQRQNAREEHRARRCHLTVTLPQKKKTYSAQFDGAAVVLHAGKLYVNLATSVFPTPPATADEGSQQPHPFTGYFLPHPLHQSRWKAAGFKGEGLVSTVQRAPPVLNWIYVDQATHEVRYGDRATAEAGGVCGPWDVTAVDRRLVFEGWEGMIAVQEDVEADLWALYFDRDDSGLRTHKGMVGAFGVPGGDESKSRLRMLEVEVWRKERRRTRSVEEEDRRERIAQREEQERKADEGRKEREGPMGTNFEIEELSSRSGPSTTDGSRQDEESESKEDEDVD